jgi:hypothetical protein
MNKKSFITLAPGLAGRLQVVVEQLLRHFLDRRLAEKPLVRLRRDLTATLTTLTSSPTGGGGGVHAGKSLFQSNEHVYIVQVMHGYRSGLLYPCLRRYSF